MASPVSVLKFEAKSHNTPDELRSPAKTRVEIVRLAGHTLARFHMEPGWRWSECVKPIVKTDSCRVSHLGYIISGRITVQLDDGTRKTIGAGESYAIPAGHDALVEGSEALVAIEVLSAEVYAKPGA
jgi:hypothetical protein